MSTTKKPSLSQEDAELLSTHLMDLRGDSRMYARLSTEDQTPNQDTRAHYGALSLDLMCRARALHRALALLEVPGIGTLDY